MRLVAAVAALLRRLRAERGVALLLFVLIALTSFAVAAGPRLFNRVADEGIRYEAERGTAIQRNLQFTRGRYGPGDGGRPVRAGSWPAAMHSGTGYRIRSRRSSASRGLSSMTPRFGIADPPSSRPLSRCASRTASRTTSS